MSDTQSALSLIQRRGGAYSAKRPWAGLQGGQTLPEMGDRRHTGENQRGQMLYLSYLGYVQRGDRGLPDIGQA